jgi:hypothetical protein
MGAAGLRNTGHSDQIPKSKFSFDIRQPSRCPEIIIFRQNYFRVGDKNEAAGAAIAAAVAGEEF